MVRTALARHLLAATGDAALVADGLMILGPIAMAVAVDLARPLVTARAMHRVRFERTRG